MENGVTITHKWEELDTPVNDITVDMSKIQVKQPIANSAVEDAESEAEWAANKPQKSTPSKTKAGSMLSLD
jgi:hypothetical protein